MNGFPVAKMLEDAPIVSHIISICLKKCTKCQKEKPKTDFKDKSNWCSFCRKAYHKEYSLKNAETARERARNWVAENPEKAKETNKKWKDKNKTKVKKYQAD